MFACIGRITDAPQVSWKTTPHESFCPDRDSNPSGEGLSDWKPMASTTRPWAPPACRPSLIKINIKLAPPACRPSLIKINIKLAPPACRPSLIKINIKL